VLQVVGVGRMEEGSNITGESPQAENLYHRRAHAYPVRPRRRLEFDMITDRAASLWRLTLLFVPLMPTVADHLPARLIAQGSPETTLAGISIRKPYATLTSIERRWGAATAVAEYHKNPCDRLVSWTLHGVAITASVGCQPPGNFVVYTVQVTGADTDRKFSTGLGLSLGDSIEKVFSIYGRRLLVSQGPEGREVIIQWSNGTELNATVAANNRIIRIQLLPQVE
jgi:hypothetical protein